MHQVCLAATSLSSTPPTSAVTTTITYNGTDFATLDGASATTESGGCQSEYITLPSGWRIAENNARARKVVGDYFWSTHLLVLHAL